MKKSRFLTRFVAAVVALALSVPVFALDLPRGARLEVHDQSGNVIGSGQVESDKVELDVLANAAGFATLVVILENGETTTYEALFSQAGDLLVVDGNEVIDLRELVRGNGLEYDFDHEDDLIRSGDDDRDDDDRDEDDRDDDDADRDDDQNDDDDDDGDDD